MSVEYPAEEVLNYLFCSKGRYTYSRNSLYLSF